jgi:hypothetical protein
VQNAAMPMSRTAAASPYVTPLREGGLLAARVEGDDEPALTAGCGWLWLAVLFVLSVYHFPSGSTGQLRAMTTNRRTTS